MGEDGGRTGRPGEYDSPPDERLGEIPAAAAEAWLTRSWRPAVMLSLAAILLTVGVLLPVAEALLGSRLAFEPRWHLLPPEFWDFLALGMGGYIGGRSLEKIAAVWRR